MAVSILDINELKQKRAKAIHEARSIIERAEADGRDLDAEEERQYNAYIEESNRLNKQIKRLEEVRRLQLSLEEAVDQAERPDPQEKRGNDDYTRRADPADPASTGEYRHAFWLYVRRDKTGMDIPEARALSVGTATAGGYLVPREFERRIIDKLNEVNVMRRLGTVIRTSGDRDIPVVSSHGSASWTGEAAAYTESDDSFTQVTLQAFKAATLIKVSEELLNDSAFDLENYIQNEFVRRISNLAESAYVNGDGTGKPTGVVQGASQGVVGAAGQTTSVTADDLIDLFHSLRPPYRQNAVWLMHDSTVKAISKLKDRNGQYLWQPGLQAGVPDRIKGRPVEVSEYMPEMAANAKSILFGDFSYYWIADRQGISFQRLNELYAGNGQVGFRGFLRTDGKLTLSEAIKYYQNSAT